MPGLLLHPERAAHSLLLRGPHRLRPLQEEDYDLPYMQGALPSSRPSHHLRKAADRHKCKFGCDVKMNFSDIVEHKKACVRRRRPRTMYGCPLDNCDFSFVSEDFKTGLRIATRHLRIKHRESLKEKPQGFYQFRIEEGN